MAWVDHWAVVFGYGGNGEMVQGLLDLVFQCYTSEMVVCNNKIGIYIIGASLSEPHINGTTVCEIYYCGICIYMWYVRHRPYVTCSRKRDH